MGDNDKKRGLPAYEKVSTLRERSNLRIDEFYIMI